MRYLLSILSAFLFTGMVAATAGNVDELFKTANGQYSKGDYNAAINTYKQALGNDNESATLYFNLANAYYKTDSIAKAILYYEKAKKLNPADESVEINLQLANKKTRDRFENISEFSLLSFLSSFTGILSVDAWAVSAIIFLILALVAFLVYFTSGSIARKKIFFRIMFTTLCISFLLFLGAELRYHTETRQVFAIVMPESADAESSPDDQGKRLYILHAGTKIKLLNKLDDWAEIRLPDNNVAWIKITDLSFI